MPRRAVRWCGRVVAGVLGLTSWRVSGFLAPPLRAPPVLRRGGARAVHRLGCEREAGGACGGEAAQLGVIAVVLAAAVGTLRVTRDAGCFMPARAVLAGGLAAATAEVAFYPLEVYKVRRQTRAAGRGRLLTSAGLVAGVARALIYHGLRLGLFPAVTRSLPANAAGALTAGALCGGGGALLVAPLDLVKTRLQRDPGRYASSSAALRAVARDRGAAGLWTAAAPTVIRAAAASAAQLTTYSAVKARVAAAAPALAVPIATVAAAVAYVTAASPADVVRATMMVAPDGSPQTAASVVADLYRAGPSAFFRGWSPALARLLPIVLLVFPLMEWLRTFLGATVF